MNNYVALLFNFEKVFGLVWKLDTCPQLAINHVMKKSTHFHICPHLLVATDQVTKKTKTPLF